jgi:hypothetical protein
MGIDGRVLSSNWRSISHHGAINHPPPRRGEAAPSPLHLHPSCFLLHLHCCCRPPLMGSRLGTNLPCRGSHGSSSRPGAARRLTTSSKSRVRAAAEPLAMEVDNEEEEVEALAERYALGGTCKVLARTPTPLGATPVISRVNFTVYSCWARSTSLGSDLMRGRQAGHHRAWRGPRCVDRFLPA